ncbi:putative lipid II flippase FtsW [Pseudarthrobacter sp. PS3-L1]|uniref:putative lipid II flippase FtsW n=1 Tax=Pseudarthrobacter sp. PS3-L1 TaxID=3046207 RepID=UPI0024B9D731|nr:putative lipid II flippase FtsW [Pseudarthrobacter sp. PS3-L1]MDJ0320387.1 putative lipid II flippase FtsW [Pseudarthrobacter sp. PS3-L1]
MVSTPTHRPPQRQKPQNEKNASSRVRVSLRPRVWFGAFWGALEGNGRSKNGSTYYLILGATLALTAIGILMVLSASSVESIAAEKSPYGDALKQGMFAVLGFAGMFILSRINVVWLKRLAWPALGIVLVLLILVQLVGDNINGNRNWINFGGFTFQPSEAAKLALTLWMASVLAMKSKLLANWKHAAVPVAPVALLVIALVLIGNDLGTAMIIMLIAAAALFFAGVRPSFFAAAAAILGVATALFAATNANRVCRITTWWTGQACENSPGADYQSTNGLYGLASGGWFGVGLGQSRQKYSWIPEAHNDFIFAIIGEELGLVGTAVVLVLFAILGTAIYRVVVAQDDLFHRVLAGTIMVWLLGQATVNMSVVTGLMPVIGVPLPFISYGGSALLMSLCAIGVVLSLAREQMPPDARPRKLLRFSKLGASMKSTRTSRARTATTVKAGTKPKTQSRPPAKSSAAAQSTKTQTRPTAPATSGKSQRTATSSRATPGTHTTRKRT